MMDIKQIVFRQAYELLPTLKDEISARIDHKTPGMCAINDAGRETAGKMIGSDVTIFLSPVTFGGYSSTLKKAVDRTRPLLSPPLRASGGKLGHVPRYSKYPRIIAIGLLPALDVDSERLYHDLAIRNSHMLHAPAHASAVIYGAESDDAVKQHMNDLVKEAGL